ncbi:MAG: C4-type zinc ribbon domain-containing protein [Planctomycetota bacterium]
MAAARNGVSELHSLYTRLRTVENQLQSAPRQIKARQQISATKQAEIEATKEKIKKLRASADQSNLQVKTNEAKVLGLKVKLNQAASNREFDALRAQVEADEMANSVLEDEILAAFEKLDRLKDDLTQYESELVVLKAAEVKLAQELAAAEEGLKTRVSEFQTYIKRAEEVIPSDIELVYRRMVQAQGPDAFAEVEGNQCQNCFVSLPAQTLMELRSGKILFCKSCRKLIHLSPRQDRDDEDDDY